MAESLFASCVFVLMIPGKVRRPSAAARRSVCLYFGVCRRPLGTLACCPTFPALMSEQDHLTGRRDGGGFASVACLYSAAARARSCSCFPRCNGAIDDNEVGHFN